VTGTSVLMLFVILPWDLPLSGFSKRVVLADGIITLFLISGVRVSKRIYGEVLRERRLKHRGGKRTLIVDAGNAGEMILRDMMKQGFDHFLPVGFLDDDQMKAGAYIYGIKVLGGTNELEGVVSARISTCAIWRRSASRICSAGKELPFPMGPIFCYTGREDDSHKTDNPQGWGVRR